VPWQGVLGLATAASIVRAGDGHLRLDSVPRLGTTVEVYLPRPDMIRTDASTPGCVIQ
jgi:signal transduction histidine kinase